MVDYATDPWAAYRNGYAFENQIGQQQQQAVENAMAKRTARQAGDALGRGDYTGAQSVFYKSGDLQNGMAVGTYAAQQKQIATTQQKAEMERTVAVLSQAAQALRGLPMEQRAQALQSQVAPTLQALKIDPAILSQLTHADLSDASLDTFTQTLGAKHREWQIVNAGDGRVVAVDPTDPSHPVTVQQGSPKPFEMDPTKNYYLPDNGQPPSAPSAAAPALAPNADAVFGAVIQQESGGRPGVTGPDTPYGNAQGETQMLPQTAQAMAQKLNVAWRPDLMTATTPEAAQYQEQLGRAYFDEGMQKYGGDVRKALMYYFGGPDEKLWGPKTHAYADQVLARTQPYQVASTGDVPPPPPPPTAQEQAAAKGGVPGYRMIQQAQPKQKDAPAGYQWKADGKSLEPIPGGPADFGPAGAPGATSDLSGDPYLSTLPKSDAQLVKALADGRMPLPSGAALKSARWQSLLAETAQYDPTFDVANQHTRVATRKSFTSGPDAGNIAAINTAIGHMDTLNNAASALNNTRIPLINRVKNAAEQATGDPRIGKFEVAKTAVANELTRVFRGSGGAEADIQAWLKTLDAAQSEDQLHAVIQQGVELLQSRLSALTEKYSQGMGRSSDPFELITPKSRAILQRLSGAPSGPAASQTGNVIRYDAQGRRIK